MAEDLKRQDGKRQGGARQSTQPAETAQFAEDLSEPDRRGTLERATPEGRFRSAAEEQIGDTSRRAEREDEPDEEDRQYGEPRGRMAGMRLRNEQQQQSRDDCDCRN
jgi:hypothetical protein